MTEKLPVLLIAYNRLDYATEVIDALVQYQPTTIYLAMDAPKNTYDEKIQESIIELASNSFVKAKMNLIQANSNLGTGFFVPEAIQQFLSHEDFGIILEDDCVPTQSFFEFCRQLNAIKNRNPKIMAICGSNLLAEGENGDEYFLGPFFVPWGWATWKTHWEKFERKEEAIEHIEEVIGNSWYRSDYLRNFMANYIASSTKLESQVWTGFWLSTIMKANGVVATPATNLVTNIGFQDQGLNADSRLQSIFSKESFEIQDPTFRESKNAELLTLENDYFKILSLASNTKSHSTSHKVTRFIHWLNYLFAKLIRCAQKLLFRD